MIFDGVLAESEQDRAERTLRKLSTHDISRWALTGGIAAEIYIRRGGGRSGSRPLHDLDFIVSSFDCIPEGVGRDFLVRHVHPYDPPGKTLLQCVDPETGVRIDVFRAYGTVVNRVAPIDSPGSLKLISIQDLTARAGRLCWDLMLDKPVAPKYAADFLRLLEVVDVHLAESIWHEHRNSWTPDSFGDAAFELRRLIESHSHLLISPTYSTDLTEVCDRCRNLATFSLAEAGQILGLLGYC